MQSLSEKVWLEFRQELQHFLLSKTGDKELANDLVQETLISGYQAKNELKNIHKLKSWLFKIAQNKLIDHYRKLSKNQTISFDLAYHDKGVIDTDSYNSLIECLDFLIQMLPTQERHILQHCDLANRPQKVVAAELSIPLSTLKSKVQRARKKLRDKLFACCPRNPTQQTRIKDAVCTTSSQSDCQCSGLNSH